MSLYLIAVLRGVHVLNAAFWFGAAAVNAFFVLPALRAAGPAGGPVSRELMAVRRMPIVINVAAVLVILSGGILIWNVSGGFAPEWFGSRYGVLLSIGATAAIVSAIHGQLVTGPTAARLGRVAAQAQAAGGPPSPEAREQIGGLQRHLESAAKLGAVLNGVAAVLMATARYW